MPLPVTEDTPPDMLTGSMDIRVLLPNGRTVSMSVERSTPMMDVLVAVTTAHKLSPAAHALSALGERGVPLHHLPSTPLGALDTRLFHLNPRNNATLKRAAPRPAVQQPFQATFRLQVHLPRNQLFVTRVGADTKLGDVLHLACAEKNLDPEKFEMRHPANLQQRLSLSHSLGDYRLQEVTLVARRPPGAPLAATDIMALHREEVVRRQQAKATGNTAYPATFGSSTQTGPGSVSSDSLNGRSVSPDGSRSLTPPIPEPPKRPGRKRRPAPKPPTAAVPLSGTTSHSRTSSDSSGYHEASVLSEGADPRNHGDSSSAGDTLPRRSKLPAEPAKDVGVVPGLSRSMSNLASVNGVPASRLASQHSASTTSLSSQGLGQRKKKAAPAPPSAPARRPVQLQPSVHVIAETNEAQPTPSRVAVKEAPPVHLQASVQVVAETKEVQPTPSRVAVKEAPPVHLQASVQVFAETKEVQPTPSRVAVEEAPPVHLQASVHVVAETKEVQPTPSKIAVEEAAPIHLVPNVHVITETKETYQTPVKVAVEEVAPVQTAVQVPVQATRKGPPTVVDINGDLTRITSVVSIHREDAVVAPPTVVAVDLAWQQEQEDTVEPEPAPLAIDRVPATPEKIVPIAPDPASLAPPPRPTPRMRPLPTPTPRMRRREVVDALPRVVSVEVKRNVDVELRTSRTSPEVGRDLGVVDASATSLSGLDALPLPGSLARWDNVDDLNGRPTFLLGHPDADDEPAGRDGTPPPSDEASPDWEYTLPAPPSAFRDTSSPEGTEFGTVVLADARVFLDADAVEVVPAPAPVDAWEPQQLVGDVRTLPDGVTREVFKVNPLFDAPRRGFAPDERELRAQSKALTSRGAGADEPLAAPLLENFTISSYSSSSTVSVKPAVPGDKPLVRTHSAAGDAAVKGMPVKRATSFLSLARPYARPAPFASIVRAQSISSLMMPEETTAAIRRAASEDDVDGDVQRVAPGAEPLQSVRLLRSILGQSQTVVVKEEATIESPEEVAVDDRLVAASPPAPTQTAPAAFVYRGPPAINFGSWSERPKVQVSLKSDKDYRIGGSTPALRRLVEDKVLHRAEPRLEPKPLTMRIVSQTYKPSSEPAPPRPSSQAVDSDVSRLPVVRAVELKKPVPPTQPVLGGTSSTRLNGDVPYEGVAKRYTSVVGVNGAGAKPMPTVKGFAVPLKTINGSQHDLRATSNWGVIRGELAKEPTPMQSSMVKETAVPLKTINGPQHNVRATSGWGAPREDPTPTSTVLKFKKPVQRPVEQKFTNPRDALMDAIKNFGGQDAMKVKHQNSG